MYWASGVHLFAPLPLISNPSLVQRIKLHSFLTAGNLVESGACVYNSVYYVSQELPKFAEMLLESDVAFITP